MRKSTATIEVMQSWVIALERVLREMDSAHYEAQFDGRASLSTAVRQVRSQLGEALVAQHLDTLSPAELLERRA